MFRWWTPYAYVLHWLIVHGPERRGRTHDGSEQFRSSSIQIGHDWKQVAAALTWKAARNLLGSEQNRDS
jgi:hypothetical protein